MSDDTSDGSRPVRTVYYRGREVVRNIASGRPLRAVQNCVGYMRRNWYEATHAEVYSTVSGKLYGVVKTDTHGNTHILYEHAATKDEREHG